MKIFIALIAPIVLACCAVMPTSKMNEIKAINHTGKKTTVFLKEMDDKGLFCQRLERLEKDQRLKSITDGTLNSVKFHECMAESDGFFCIARSSTFIVSQYDKILGINGTNESKVCIWN